MAISYLKKYREEVPAWIEDYLRGKQISFKDVMSSRVGYYPGSRFDGTLMKVCNMAHCVHSFLYVDYGLSRQDLEDHIAENSIRGYHPVGRIEWTEADLMPHGKYPPNIRRKPLHADSPKTSFGPPEPPYCFSLFLERNEGIDESWGARHFVVTFLYADGIDTYYQFFVREYAKAPWIFLLQDHGWGGNYDRFGKGGILDAIIRRNRCYPSFVLCGRNTHIWNHYVRIENVKHVRLREGHILQTYFLYQAEEAIMKYNAARDESWREAHEEENNSREDRHLTDIFTKGLFNGGLDQNT